MSHVATCLLLVLGLPSIALGIRNEDPVRTPLTIILQIEKDAPDKIITAMKSEVIKIFNDVPYRFDWRVAEELHDSESFNDLIVVKFRGNCAPEPGPFLYDERGPLGLTNITDGRLLPFASLDCDRLRNTLKQPLAETSSSTWTLVFGRALGRILAHEMYHVLARTEMHSKTGVTKSALSARELAGSDLPMDAESVRRIAQAASTNPAARSNSNGF